MRARLHTAEEALQRLQDAMVAGVDPFAPAAERLLDVAEVYAMIDELGDVGGAIAGARPDSLAKLYRELDTTVRCQPEKYRGSAIISLVVANVRVRRGS